MPVIDGVGVSSHTHGKQMLFNRLITRHLQQLGTEIKEQSANSYYFYLDMSAGPGLYWNPTGDNLIVGSPLWFLTAAKKTRTDYRAILCEATPTTCARLAANTTAFLHRKRILEFTSSMNIDEPIAEDVLRLFKRKCDFPGVVIEQEHILHDIGYWADAHDTIAPFAAAKKLICVLRVNSTRTVHKLPEIIFPGGRKFGLMYIDINGVTSLFDFLMQLDLAGEFGGIDILIYLAAGTYKKIRSCSRTSITKPLADVLKEIDRPIWYIKKPQGSSQWTFLLGATRKRKIDYDYLGLYDVKSLEGSKILYRLTYSESERLTRGGA